MGHAFLREECKKWSNDGKHSYNFRVLPEIK